MKSKRQELILEIIAREDIETQNQLLEALSTVLQPNTMICVACDLTLPTQYIRSLPSAKWKTERSKIDLHKRNTVFLIG